MSVATDALKEARAHARFVKGSLAHGKVADARVHAERAIRAAKRWLPSASSATQIALSDFVFYDDWGHSLPPSALMLIGDLGGRR